MKRNNVILLVFCISALFFLQSPAMAINATWTYSQKGADIGSIALSSNGDLIAIGAGKILMFSRDGRLLSKTPFGESVAITPDGSTLASAYYSKIYFFQKNATPGSAGMNEIWETELNGNVRSMALSDTGKIMAFSTDGGGVYIYRSDGTPTGYNKTFASVVRTTSYGDMIVGISQQGIASYTYNGIPLGDFDVSIDTNPNTMALTSTGNLLVFNSDQMVRCVYTENGTYVWKQRATGSVDSLAITPNGAHIIFGTDNGHIDHFDATGNRTWSYNANPKNNGNAGINSVAVSDNGGSIVAGTNDGQILALDAKGEVQWSNLTDDHIRHVSVSADGSTVVATGDETIYAFSKMPAISHRPVPGTVRSYPTTLGTVSRIAAAATPLPETTSEPGITSPVPTQYSVILTPQGSPLSPGTGLVAILFIILVYRRT